jgi:ribosomal subunit interface protein
MFDINNIQLKLQSPHVNTGDALREFILEHIEKLGKIFERFNKCEVMLREENGRKHTSEADIKIFVPGNVLYAQGRANDFRLAVTEAFDDIEDQLIRYKEKLKDIKPNEKPEGIEG